MPRRLDHGVTASVGTDEATKSILLSRMLLVVVVLNRWLGEVNPLEHHNVLLDLPRLLILPKHIVERANLMRSSDTTVAMQILLCQVESRAASLGRITRQ